MIVDTSVIVAILRAEPEAAYLLGKLATAATRLLSAGSWVELGAVTSKEGDEELPRFLEHLLSSLGIVVEPVDRLQAQIGHEAYRRFGKGHHPAHLNFGDCFAYALAKATGEPLLFKGADFSQTDIISAL